jgi:pyruvate/2-oxoglutarate dehydrogenase complex dihydrolipoamide dehydrogenase (E3) component
VADRIRDEATDDWNDQVAVDRFTGKGGHFVRGRARLTGPRQVTVDGEEFTVERGVVLATGTRPQILPIPGLDATPYWTNRDAVSAKEPPASLIVLGGGSIGVELAQIFARFGTRVTVVEVLDHLVPSEEPEAGDLLAEVLRGEDVQVRTGVRADRVDHSPASGFSVRLSDGGTVTAERLLVATGRRVDLSGLGVEHAGLDPQARAVAVNGQLRAGDGLWAVGDVTGKGAFTHVAMYQAEIAIRDILGTPGPDADYRALPKVTFADPEIGSVGLTEAQARDKGLRVRTGTAPLPYSARGWIHKAGNQGLIKLVEDADRGVLVGATSVGPAGGEVLYGLAVAVQAEVPVSRLRHMIYAYPTFHRAVEDALAKLG